MTCQTTKSWNAPDMAFVLPTLITVLLVYRRLCRNAGRQTRSNDRLSQSYWLYLTAQEWTLSCNARYKELRLLSIRNDHFHWSWAKPLDIPHIQEACFNVTGCTFFKQYICLAWTLCSPNQPFLSSHNATPIVHWVFCREMTVWSTAGYRPTSSG